MAQLSAVCRSDNSILFLQLSLSAEAKFSFLQKIKQVSINCVEVTVICVFHLKKNSFAFTKGMTDQSAECHHGMH